VTVLTPSAYSKTKGGDCWGVVQWMEKVFSGGCSGVVGFITRVGGD
jgi:hypothetical protein